MRGIFLLLFLKFALVLNTFVRATSFNISITRGNKDHVDEKRDFITLPPVLCENVRNSCPKKVAAVHLTYSEEKKSCKCMCYGCKIFSEKWNECVRPEEIRRDEGCVDFTSTNDSSKTTCNSSNILQKSNILVLRRPTGFEECRVVLNGSEADTKFLDCNGKWKNISERYALDAFQTNNNRYMNRAIIKLRNNNHNDLGGRMIKVTVKCRNKSAPGDNRRTCALFRIYGTISCPYVHAAKPTAVTTRNITLHLPCRIQKKDMSKVLIQYSGYALALVLGICFVVALVSLNGKRRQIREYERKTEIRPHQKNIYGPPKPESELEEDYDDVLICSMQQSQRSNQRQDTVGYEEIGTPNHHHSEVGTPKDHHRVIGTQNHPPSVPRKPLLPTNRKEFAYINWKEIPKKLNTLGTSVHYQNRDHEYDNE